MPRTSKKARTPLDWDALESLAWASDVVLESFGMRLRIRSTGAGVLDEVMRRMPYDAVVEGHGSADCVISAVGEVGPYPDCFGLYVGAERQMQAMGFEETWAAIESSANLYVAEHAPDRIFLHSGCVTWKGKAILVPGRSFSGKTSMVTAFLSAGATYYSDEYAVLDERGLVHPFPRLLSVRSTTGALPDKVSHDSFSAPVGVEPAEVACVIHTSFEAARVGRPWRPRRLTPGRMTLALLDNAVPARNKPGATLRAIKNVAERAIGFAGPRGEAQTVVRYVLRRLAG
jgi:hypothetical protein